MHLKSLLFMLIGGVGITAYPIHIWAQAAGRSVSTLGLPQKTVEFSSHAPEHATTPFFNHGYLIQFKHVVDSATTPDIFLYNSSGQIEHEISAWPPEAAKLFLTSVDVGADQQLIYAGRMTKQDGTRVPFVAFSDLAGTRSTYFETRNYLATQIALADDGTVWTIGGEYALPGSDSQKRWQNYDSLRHYNAAGLLLGHFLSRWTSNVAYVVETNDNNGKKDDAYDQKGELVPEEPPSTGYANAWARGSQLYLKTSRQTTVFYDGIEGYLYRYDAFHHTLDRMIVDRHYTDVMPISGFALSANGRIFASLRGGTQSNPRHPILVELFASPDGTAQWSQLRYLPGQHDLAQRPQQLLGIDLDTLVYRAGSGLVTWSSVH